MLIYTHLTLEIWSLCLHKLPVFCSSELFSRTSFILQFFLYNSIQVYCSPNCVLLIRRCVANFLGSLLIGLARAPYRRLTAFLAAIFAWPRSCNGVLLLHSSPGSVFYTGFIFIVLLFHFYIIHRNNLPLIPVWFGKEFNKIIIMFNTTLSRNYIDVDTFKK